MKIITFLLLLLTTFCVKSQTVQYSSGMTTNGATLYGPANASVNNTNYTFQLPTNLPPSNTNFTLATAATATTTYLRTGSIVFASAITTNGTVTFSTPLPGNITNNYYIQLIFNSTSGSTYPIVETSGLTSNGFTLTSWASFLGRFDYKVSITE